jgi:Mg-chelatase subunit ChlD
MFSLLKNLFRSASNPQKRRPNHQPKHVGKSKAPPINVGPTHKVFGSDHLGIVAFHGSGFVVARPAKPHDGWLQQRIASLPSKLEPTGTNIAAGLRTAIEVFDRMPPDLQQGALKRLWVFSDGQPTAEESAILGLCAQAKARRININTVGFGDTGEYNERLLKSMAAATHNGKFIRVDDLEALSRALTASGPKPGHQLRTRRHRMEFTVVAVDCSLSMNETMRGHRKIEMAAKALCHLLHYKQKVFA